MQTRSILVEMNGDMERALGALKDFTRRDILLRFYADRKPRSVEDVAREAGVHRSVAFEHLERLVALGYLEVAHRRGLPGKPAKIYKLTGGPVQISHPMRRYDVVAESLGRAFDELGDVGSHAVRRAGRNFGESIAQPGAKTVMRALEPMLEMGAEYESERGGIVECTNCLFAEVCRRAPVICRFHAGIVEGLLLHTELNVSVKALGFRDPYGCAYMVQENVLAEDLEERRAAER
jgi:predicted ArsR family transcriptional regulator